MEPFAIFLDLWSWILPLILSFVSGPLGFSDLLQLSSLPVWICLAKRKRVRFQEPDEVSRVSRTPPGFHYDFLLSVSDCFPGP